jgi:hypothetical protein
MNIPRIREEKRVLHIDKSVGSYRIRFGNDVPIQDYNNVSKLRLKAFKFASPPPSTEYIIMKIKNIDGKIDSNITKGQDASAIIYFDGDKPSFFNDTVFVFSPVIKKLTELNVELYDSSENLLSNSRHSYVFEVSYVEGNQY